jgi:hypothetical protein
MESVRALTRTRRLGDSGERRTNAGLPEGAIDDAVAIEIIR